MKREITYNIPGGWYGNDPGFNSNNLKVGNIAINPAKAVQAIKWLNRRAQINEISVSDEPVGHSLLINYTLR